MKLLMPSVVSTMYTVRVQFSTVLVYKALLIHHTLLFKGYLYLQFCFFRYVFFNKQSVWEPRNRFQTIDSVILCILAGLYNNHMCRNGLPGYIL
jgi:hypothetical protein